MSEVIKASTSSSTVSLSTVNILWLLDGNTYRNVFTFPHLMRMQ